MKTHKNILFGLLIFISSAVAAQDSKSCPKVEEMHARKWQFLVEQALLSAKEADVVKPIFMNYETLVWTQHQQNHAFFKLALKKQAAEKPNYSELNDRYVESEVKQSQLFKSYHLQLRKVLQPETLFKYYKAEREFKRKLLQGMPGRLPSGGRL
jgi:hypothetical protein